MAQQAETSAVSQLARAHEAAASAKAEAVERDAASKRALDDAVQRADAARRVSEEAGAADLFLGTAFWSVPDGERRAALYGPHGEGPPTERKRRLGPTLQRFFSRRLGEDPCRSEGA